MRARSERGGRARRGFTLIEILVVVLIITILATVVGVNVARQPGRARVAAALAQLRNLDTALKLYRMDQGAFPTTEQGLDALCQPAAVPPRPVRFPEGGYLEQLTVPVDPWGRPYVYISPGVQDAPYDLLSYGADGEPGGSGENADIALGGGA